MTPTKEYICKIQNEDIVSRPLYASNKYLVKIGRLRPISPGIIPQHVHDREVGEIRHVGDLGDGLEDAPGEELVDDASPALGARDHNPPQGDAPRQPGQPLVEPGLVRAPGRILDLVLPSQVRYSKDALPTDREGCQPESDVRGLEGNEEFDQYVGSKDHN